MLGLAERDDEQADVHRSQVLRLSGRVRRSRQLGGELRRLCTRVGAREGHTIGKYGGLSRQSKRRQLLLLSRSLLFLLIFILSFFVCFIVFFFVVVLILFFASGFIHLLHFTPRRKSTRMWNFTIDHYVYGLESGTGGRLRVVLADRFAWLFLVLRLLLRLRFLLFLLLLWLLFLLLLWLFQLWLLLFFILFRLAIVQQQRPSQLPKMLLSRTHGSESHGRRTEFRTRHTHRHSFWATVTQLESTRGTHHCTENGAGGSRILGLRLLRQEPRTLGRRQRKHLLATSALVLQGAQRSSHLLRHLQGKLVLRQRTKILRRPALRTTASRIIREEKALENQRTQVNQPTHRIQHPTIATHGTRRSGRRFNQDSPVNNACMTSMSQNPDTFESQLDL